MLCFDYNGYKNVFGRLRKDIGGFMELIEIKKKKWFVRVDKNIKKEIKLLLVPEAKNKSRAKMSFYDSGELSSFSINSLGEQIIDESKALTFSKLVKKHMEEKNITTKDIYRNSLIDRKLFSALNVNDKYTPTKETAIMYCFALGLNLDESKELLNSAGYALYKFSNFDIVVEYFLKNKIYNIDKLNDALYTYTKKCIGYR